MIIIMKNNFSILHLIVTKGLFWKITIINFKKGEYNLDQPKTYNYIKNPSKTSIKIKILTRELITTYSVKI